jgi:DNA-binding protein WhiA
MNRLLSTFTGTVKEELTTKPYETERLISIFAGFSKVNGRYTIGKNGQKLVLVSSYSKIAKFMYETGLLLFKTQASFAYRQSPRFSKRREYVVIFEEGIETILEAIHLDFSSSEKSYLRQFQTLDRIAGFLTGVFLAAGSVTHPESSHYHLELSSEDETLLEDIQFVLKKVKQFDFNFKLAHRKGKAILYLKKSDQIADFLIFLGATDATLDYENIRIARDFSNSENRLQICQTANMSKTIQAAQRQISDIKFVDQLVGLKALGNDKLHRLCLLRLEHDSSSLEELSVMMKDFYPSPMSKSHLNHMFRYLHQVALKLKGTAS